MHSGIAGRPVLRGWTIALLMMGAAVDAKPRARAPDLSLVGSYGAAEGDATILERDGVLFLARKGHAAEPLKPLGSRRYRAGSTEAAVTGNGLTIDGRTLARHDFGAETEAAIRAAVRRDGAALRQAALAATPPAEPRTRRQSDLVSLDGLVPHIRIDTRYASANNFTGQPIYERAGAYLQRPAADALARVAAELAEKGYGLIVYDGYRPWFATKLFWDIVPEDKHVFVADPAKGSRHNRGCAVDLGLYDLKTGAVSPMPSRYDEMSVRAYADFAGGTDAERANRALLRAAMEREGFAVYDSEWWHFDYRDWADYPIGTASFTQIESGRQR
jgi:D-alanyl-D-alanine dipeptidase